MGKRVVGGVPARVPDAVIGPAHSAFEPERLDVTIRESLGSLERQLQTWTKLEPLVHAFLEYLGVSIAEIVQLEQTMPGKVFYFTKDGKPSTKDAWARETMGNLTTYVERLSRGMTNILKLVNDTARLRVFLTGGERDIDEDLDSMSDAQLAKLLGDVAKGRLGMTRAKG